MRPNLKKILPRRIPKGYRLCVDGWSFNREKLEERLLDGTRKLLTLDISLSPEKFVREVNNGNIKGLKSRADRAYSTICPNNCRGCFEKGEITNYLLSWEDIKKYLEEAIKLGLESVKFLGPGELFTNPDLFKILDYFQRKRIKIGIFTKGETLGDDELARKYRGMSSKELAKRVCGYEVTRVLIDCRTFDEKKANNMVHSLSRNYALARKKAIEFLSQNEMNRDIYCQRMSLQTNPVTEENINDVFEIFKWGTERNIPVCVTPTMVSGRGIYLVKQAQRPEFQEELIQLYTNIYVYLIERGVMPLEQLREEGISSYAGITPCNQLSCGMFIRKDGVVQSCPGNDSREFITANDIRQKPLKEIWTKSRNYALGPVFNNRCVKDGFSIPSRLYYEVLKRVESKFEN